MIAVAETSELFFLKPRWIGNCCIISANVVGIYSFINALSYIRFKESITPVLGVVKMSFPSSVSFIMLSTCVGWLGWIVKHSKPVIVSERRLWMWSLPPEKFVQVLAAAANVIALVGAAIVAISRLGGGE